MKTSNFDLLFEINEDLINRAFAIAFYTSALPASVEGTVAVSAKATRKCNTWAISTSSAEPERTFQTVDAIQEQAVRLFFNIKSTSACCTA